MELPTFTFHWHLWPSWWSLLFGNLTSVELTTVTCQLFTRLNVICLRSLSNREWSGSQSESWSVSWSLSISASQSVSQSVSQSATSSQHAIKQNLTPINSFEHVTHNIFGQIRYLSIRFTSWRPKRCSRLFSSRYNHRGNTRYSKIGMPDQADGIYTLF